MVHFYWASPTYGPIHFNTMSAADSVACGQHSTCDSNAHKWLVSEYGGKHTSDTGVVRFHVDGLHLAMFGENGVTFRSVLAEHRGRIEKQIELLGKGAGWIAQEAYLGIDISGSPLYTIFCAPKTHQNRRLMTHAALGTGIERLSPSSHARHLTQLLVRNPFTTLKDLHKRVVHTDDKDTSGILQFIRVDVARYMSGRT